MNPIDPKITGFILEHHVLTLAVSRDNVPWCAHCFYVYLPEKNCFIFTSDPDTRHVRDVEEGANYRVTAGIALETKIVGRIRGIQLSGTIRLLEGKERKEAQQAYVKRFPVAMLATLTLWALEPDFIKLTDNRLGFGKKLKWELLR